MFCIKCGERLAEGASFCTKCGNKQESLVANIQATTKTDTFDNTTNHSAPQRNVMAQHGISISGISKQKIILLAIAAIGIISAFLPWVSMLGINTSGIQGDGWLTIVTFGAVIPVCLRGDRTQTLGSIAGWICRGVGLTNVGIAVNLINNVSGLEWFGATVGAGGYLMLLAGIAVFAVSFWRIR